MMVLITANCGYLQASRTAHLVVPAGGAQRLRAIPGVSGLEVTVTQDPQ